MGAFVLVAAAHPDPKRHLPARAGGEPVADRDQIAGDQREQIRGLGVRVDPFRPVPAPPCFPALGLARPGRVAVRQQHRKLRLVGDDRRRIARHYIRPVDEIGDPAKALGLALGAEIAARHIEPGQRGVFVGRNEGFDVEGEGIRHVVDDQPAFGRQPIAVRPQRLAIERHRDQLQLLAVELQRTLRVRARRVAANAEPRLDPRVRAVEVENQVHGIDQKFGRPVIRQPDRLRRRDIGRKVEHGGLPSRVQGSPTLARRRPR